MLVVNQSGRRTFYQVFRLDGKVVWFQLGDWTGEEGADVEWARGECARIRKLVKDGLDPRAIREETNRKRVEAETRPRWEELMDLYIERSKLEHKPRTIAWAVDLIETHLDASFRERHLADPVLYPPDVKRRKRRKKTPAQGAKHLAGRFVADITKDDLRQLHQTVKATGAGVTADRCIALLRKAFNLAKGKTPAWRSDNPATDLDLAKSGNTRAEFLDGEHLFALGEALQRAEEKNSPCWQAIAMVRLLLATGLRLSEVLTLKWSEVDLHRGILRKKDHKTSKKTGDLVQPLSAEAWDILKSIAERCLKPTKDNKRPKLSTWVLPSDLDARKHFNGPQKAWQTIREDAGLESFRIHDLRRSFASWAALTGVDLATASKLLNHSDVRITSKIYAQASLDTKRTGADTIAAGIKNAMQGAK
jgi:integrase